MYDQADRGPGVRDEPVLRGTRGSAELPPHADLPAPRAVQHSADGSAYAQYADMGAEMATAFTGSEPRGVWCTYGSAPGKARLAAASHTLTSAFGSLPRHSSGDPAETVTVQDAHQGWAVASWLVANASQYEQDEWYRSHQWLGFVAPAPDQNRVDPQARAGPSAVVFADSSASQAACCVGPILAGNAILVVQGRDTLVSQSLMRTRRGRKRRTRKDFHIITQPCVDGLRYASTRVPGSTASIEAGADAHIHPDMRGLRRSRARLPGRGHLR